MRTLYDVVTLALFAGLAILFLQRSADGAQDRVISYLPAAVGCALANWLGNGGHHAAAIVTLIAAAVYSVVVLKPTRRNP
jgi:hypothetical protein